MSHAKRLAVLVAAAAAVGCCPVRWPSSQRLAPAQSFIRYVALAVKDGDERCAVEAKTKEEAEACIQVYGELKTVLIKLEGP
jgi:phosphotransferase system HPr-like phosphotransfer protein